jgi:hypothetical protein
MHRPASSSSSRAFEQRQMHVAAAVMHLKGRCTGHHAQACKQQQRQQQQCSQAEAHARPTCCHAPETVLHRAPCTVMQPEETLTRHARCRWFERSARKHPARCETTANKPYLPWELDPHVTNLCAFLLHMELSRLCVKPGPTQATYQACRV